MALTDSELLDLIDGALKGTLERGVASYSLPDGRSLDAMNAAELLKERQKVVARMHRRQHGKYRGIKPRRSYGAGEAIDPDDRIHR